MFDLKSTANSFAFYNFLKIGPLNGQLFFFLSNSFLKLSFPILHHGELQTTCKSLSPKIHPPYCTVYNVNILLVLTHFTLTQYNITQYCRQELWCRFPSDFLGNSGTWKTKGGAVPSQRIYILWFKQS